MTTHPGEGLAGSLPFSAAAERNRGPILAALAQLLPAEARVLEIASGSGQHAAHFARARPRWSWQPTEADAQHLRAIDARCAGIANVLPARRLDVTTTPPWPVPNESCTAIFCANLVHIAPWPCCVALMAGAAAHLQGGGALVLYGPFMVDGEPLAASNAAFDASLRERNPAWGVRRLSAVADAAADAGLHLAQRIAMPANNLLVVLCRPVAHAAAAGAPP